MGDLSTLNIEEVESTGKELCRYVETTSDSLKQRSVSAKQQATDSTESTLVVNRLVSQMDEAILTKKQYASCTVPVHTLNSWKQIAENVSQLPGVDAAVAESIASGSLVLVRPVTAIPLEFIHTINAKCRAYLFAIQSQLASKESMITDFQTRDTLVSQIDSAYLELTALARDVSNALAREINQNALLDGQYTDALELEVTQINNTISTNAMNLKSIQELEAWKRENADSIRTIDKWLQDLWQCIVSKHIAEILCKSIQKIQESASLASGAMIEFSVQTISNYINDFMQQILPQDNIKISLVLNNPKKFSLVDECDTDTVVPPQQIEPLTLTDARQMDRTTSRPPPPPPASESNRVTKRNFNAKCQILVAVTMGQGTIDINALSGGQFYAVQLASLCACAIFYQTKFVILDETMSSFDEKTVYNATQPLITLAKQHNVLVLSSAHNSQQDRFDHILHLNRSSVNLKCDR